VIGQSPRRKEDERLITGRGRFIDDIVPPRLCHLRSSAARAARIVRIDAARNFGSVFLAADLPRRDPCPSRADHQPLVRLDAPQPAWWSAASASRSRRSSLDPYQAADAASWFGRVRAHCRRRVKRR
jgi:CO/xanthine dehydrogenase Mo-binding subunit